MGDAPPIENLTNAAWIKIPTKLAVNDLSEFCSHLERLFRLNPYLQIELWQPKSLSLTEVKWENHSNTETFTVETTMQALKNKNEIEINYSKGIKQKTFFIIEPFEQDSALLIVDDYGDSEPDKLGGVDKSLQAWGVSLERFFKHYALLKKIPGIDIVIDRFWIRLSPMARRITYILLVITIVEVIALILFVLLLLLS